jgi:outer membrane biosynthesis protein TonB
MEPIKINVNIEVGLKQSTIEALKSIFGPQFVHSPVCINLEDQEPQPEQQPKKTKKQAPQPAPEPQPQGEDPEGTGAEDIGDLPADDAPDPAPKGPTPTEADARNAVAAARKRGVAPAKIRSYMKENFNIGTSVECPAERRQELIDGLNKLAA